MNGEAIEKNVTNQVKIAALQTQVTELLAIIAAMQRRQQIHADKITILEGRK
jgi:hypothetical protein